MSDKLWSVKAYQYVEGQPILNNEGYETKVRNYTRKLMVVGKNLTWEKANELRKEYASMGASIFPNVKEEELKVIKLG